MWSYKEKCDGISSPVTADGIIYVASKGTTALKPVSGDAPEIVWNGSTLLPGAASMLLADGRLYMINRAGVLVCADAKDGQIVWRVRLQGEFWGTPALVGDRLYCVSSDGKVQVVQIAGDGKSAKEIGGGQLEGPVMGSPAVSGGALYVRNDGHLWKIADE